MEINVTQIIIAVVGMIFTVLISPLIKAGFAWLKTKTQSEALKTAIFEAENLVENIVANLQTNVVDGLKEANTDGKLTKAEIEGLAQEAFSMFVSDLSTQSIDVLMSKVDDIDQYLQGLVEKKLLELKK